MGLEAWMLTGDQPETAHAIARETGISHVKAGLLPKDKADFIRQLQAEGRRVAMIGDGINDSAALAAADLSIAMGHGSDIAMDTAMVTILSSDLEKYRNSSVFRTSRCAQSVKTCFGPFSTTLSVCPLRPVCSTRSTVSCSILP